MSLLDTIREVQTALGVEADGYAGPVTWDAILQAVRGLAGQAGPDGQAGAPVAPDASDLDARTRACLASLLPEVQALALPFLKEVRASGVDARIISGTRTYAEQDELYQHGRSKPGPIVTNAPAGYSNHNFGLAFDIGIFRNGRYLDEDASYRAVAGIGKAHGLTWGGDWQSIQDEPHYELRPGWAAHLSESQLLAELRRRKEVGKDFFA